MNPFMSIDDKTQDYGKFSVVNFGKHYYYPPKDLQEGLEKVIIFAENKEKSMIPYGSVFVYDENAPYHPEILSSDVGCGVSSYSILGDLDFSRQENVNLALRAVNAIGVHIGQGNHFIMFTTGNFSLDHITKKAGFESSSVFLHTDFNNENLIPRTYKEAKELEKIAKEKRIDFLGKLLTNMEIEKISFYRENWTHNSVNKEDGKLVYRKGAINLREGEYPEGLLFLNPIDGFLSYIDDNEDFQYSMQESVGRIDSRGRLLECMNKTKIGNAIGYTLEPWEETKEIEKIKNETYNSVFKYTKNFGVPHFSGCFNLSKLMIITKN